MEDKNCSSSSSSSSSSSLYLLTNGATSSPPPSTYFEIRLFYVRIAPCAVSAVPDHLTIRHIRREIGASLEINGSYVPASDSSSLKLRCDRIDKEASEVTYVSTDTVRVIGAVEFEVYEREAMVLCGSLERVETVWGNGGIGGLEKDERTGWSMDCNAAAAMMLGCLSSAPPPSIEVYVAGCSAGVPLILTKTIQHSPRRKPPRHGMLDAIPEDEETGKGENGVNGVVQRRKLQDLIDEWNGKDGDTTKGGGTTPHNRSRELPLTRSEAIDLEVEEYDSDEKLSHGYYSEDLYADEDGQLSWFNAGVRVGVGIGLGMCIGIGIGVGLLMRSYQATTRTFRRRFL
ncbi:hypothetical protein Scep_026314 [Stephania cephalantha]|uniref:Erythronate-4-phosphate dehydrogenase family protein n=1 Tax=Stephania cephalantha TaxID=152367 RepID=A0AAP0HT77_9MAGN